jgi:GT2 family glycosyltransferase/glycosyltransferase involved in cell wall biosynthesis
LLFRSLLALINAMTRFGRPAPHAEGLTRQQFIDAVLAEVGLSLQEADYARYIAIEADIQQAVTGRPASLFADWGRQNPLPMQTLAQAVKERATEVEHLRYIIGERDKTIAGLQQGIGDGAMQLQQLTQAMAERDAQLQHAQEIISQRDQQAQTLLQLVGERDATVQAQQHVIGERDAAVGELQRLLAEQAGPMAELRQKVNNGDAENGHLREILRQREVAFLSIINSRSWWLTKPYRWVGRVLRGDLAGAADPFQKMLGLKKDGQAPIAAVSVELPAPAAAAAPADIVVPDPIAPTHTVSVILPVYRGIDMTRRCIEAAMPGVLAMDGAILLAINDGSPDQGMQAMLESLVAIWPGRFEVLENPVNLGFVGTVNRGMAHFPSQDVVLLNSDVIVPVDWLKRLQVEAYSHPRVATVTPFSNNATICSFPNFLEENPQAFNLDVHTIDAVFRQSKLPCVSAPTGIGFCMFIRRACLDQIGYLNAEKFGRGYGEENDLCQRALKAGWLNILSPNMYAFHEGGVSFSTDKQALVDRAMGVLDSLHPNYHADVQAFIQRDPVRSARVERYLQLLATLSLPKVLHVSHGSGGGVGQHIEELAGYFDQGAAHLVLAPQDGPAVVSLSLRSCKLTDKLLFDMPADYAKLRKLLEQVGISAVHYHHTYNLDPVLQNLARELRATSLLTAHDYYWLNANPTLTAADGRFPGQYVEDQHNPLYPLPPGVTAVQWREKLRPLIEQADCVIFPTNATRSMFGEMYRLNNAVVAPHVEPHLDVRQAPRQLVAKQHYVVGVLGAVGREKGADVLETLAEMAQSQGAQFSFKLIGYSYRQLNAVETTGPYKVENLSALIAQHEVDLILFPAQWPETYSYTLSHALASGLPIIAPNLGAFPERLSGRASASLFDHMEPVAELYRHIGNFIGELETGTACAPVFQGDQSQLEFYARDYLPLLARALKPPVSGKPSFEFDATHIVRGPLNKTGWRHAVLRGLWRLHTHPSLRWASAAMPYGLKRAVKRSLSRSPMHDITIKS